MSDLKILTSGNLSGMGKYIYDHLGGTGLNRETTKEELDSLKKEGVDIIIHCAFNSSRDLNSGSLYEYYADNVSLTSELAGIPHKKFIFFSTVDLYCRDESIKVEDTLINMDKVHGIYAVTKLMSEAIVREKCQNSVVLRPTTLVGRDARKNTLLKIISGESDNCYLSGDSLFNYVLHSDICGFIEKAIENDIQGTFNVASSGNVRLSEVACMMGRNVKFGLHRYDVGNISNQKIISLHPAFNKSSVEVLKEFTGEHAHV